MQPQTIQLDAFQVVGYRLEATVQEFEAGLGQDTYHALVNRKHELSSINQDEVLLIQIYPEDEGFDPKSDTFSHIIGYRTAGIVEAPSELIIHHIDKSSYVRYTHVSPESALNETYDYLYQEWIPSQGYELRDYDFEVWGAAYQPESEANKIELYIAIN